MSAQGRSTTSATGIVTLTELAGGGNNKLLNLLVVLQSLDSDGNRGNGITIPLVAASAFTAIDLTVAPASLSTTALQTAMAAGSITIPIVSTTDAQVHYITQGMSSLTSFDANGYGLAATTSVDTNGTAGLPHPHACNRLRSTGDELIHTSGTANTDGSCTVIATEKLAKADNDPTGIVGVWAENSLTNLREGHPALFANGRFLFYGAPDPFTAGEIEGIESGTYSYNTTSKEFKFVTVDVDTNGTNGIADSEKVVSR